DGAAQGGLQPRRSVQPRQDVSHFQGLRRGDAARALGGLMTGVETEWVIRELRRGLGEKNVLTGDAASAFALGDAPPLAAAFPRNREGVQQVVAMAMEHGLSLLPWGGGTDLSPSLQPPALMLGTQRLNRLIDYQ